ncbi:MAG TPA: hypothetical protein EYO94_13030 [Acidobacteria bacterium]|nr:hypothetical protein [Acidobacteriota bacterium]
MILGIKTNTVLGHTFSPGSQHTPTYLNHASLDGERSRAELGRRFLDSQPRNVHPGYMQAYRWFDTQ